MVSELNRRRKGKSAKRKLEDLFERDDLTLVIHYSCEGFNVDDRKWSSRIVCICVRYLHSGETRTFSIYHFAERLGVKPIDILEEYSRIEKALLDEYFQFVSKHINYTWAHWNMRNINYGFHALEHRYEVHGGDPIVISDDKKVDIAATLQDIYGVEYAQKPVLVNLCKLNRIESTYFLPGKEEAEEFERGEFKRIFQSTQKKVDFISYVAERAVDNELKTFATFKSRYGIYPKIIVEYIEEQWIYALIAMIVTVVSFASFVL